LLLHVLFLKGGKEGIADTEGKSKEELYMEAKDILALISSPGESPNTTMALRYTIGYHRELALNII